MEAKELGPRAGKAILLKVWDLPTRLFHWVLVLLILAAWLSVENGQMELHAVIGQTILVLIVFRLIWGVVGSQTAQFRSFVKGPAAIRAYIQGLFTGQEQPNAGHNPTGALMVLLLLALVGAQATLGLFANDDILFEGPLFHLVEKSTSDRITGIHRLLFNFIWAAIAVHILASIFYLAVKRENLIGAMFTGRKKWYGPQPSLSFAPLWLAAVVLLVSAALVWAAVTWL